MLRARQKVIERERNRGRERKRERERERERETERGRERERDVEYGCFIFIFIFKRKDGGALAPLSYLVINNSDKSAASFRHQVAAWVSDIF